MAIGGLRWTVRKRGIKVDVASRDCLRLRAPQDDQTRFSVSADRLASIFKAFLPYTNLQSARSLKNWWP